MKVRFESEKDIENELNVMNLICPDKQFKKLGEHDLDFLVYDVRNGKNIGLCYIEIKCYKGKHDDYTTTMVSCIKYRKMMEKALPTYLFIQWNDKLVYINRNDISGEQRIGGRKVREGSTNDQEMLIFVPMEKFNIYE